MKILGTILEFYLPQTPWRALHPISLGYEASSFLLAFPIVGRQQGYQAKSSEFLNLNQAVVKQFQKPWMTGFLSLFFLSFFFFWLCSSLKWANWEGKGRSGVQVSGVGLCWVRIPGNHYCMTVYALWMWLWWSLSRECVKTCFFFLSSSYQLFYRTSCRDVSTCLNKGTTDCYLPLQYPTYFCIHPSTNACNEHLVCLVSWYVMVIDKPNVVPAVKVTLAMAEVYAKGQVHGAGMVLWECVWVLKNV
jgi:hypothetical protein